MQLKKKTKRLHKHVYYAVNSEEIGQRFDKETGTLTKIHKRGVVFLCGICSKRKQKIFFVDTALNNRLNHRVKGQHEVILQDEFMKLVLGDVEEEVVKDGE